MVHAHVAWARSIAAGDLHMMSFGMSHPSEADFLVQTRTKQSSDKQDSRRKDTKPKGFAL